MGKLTISSFLAGLKRDGEPTGDYKVYSLYDCRNVDFDYSTGACRRRRGYTDWISIGASGDRILQAHSFVNNSGSEWIICLVQIVADTPDTYEVWAVPVTAGVAGTAVKIYDGDENMPTRFPAVVYGNRVFFGTETTTGKGFYWADETSIGATTSYQVGIDAPTVAPQLLQDDLTEQGASDDSTRLGNDGTTTEALAQTFQISATGNNTVIGGIQVYAQRQGLVDRAGRIKLEVRSSSETGTLLGEGGIDVADIPIVNDWVSIMLDDPLTLANGTYAYVLDGDAGYDAHYDPAVHDVIFTHQGGNPYADGAARRNNNGSWENIDDDDFQFIIGIGLTNGGGYRYNISYYNDTYGSESPLMTSFQTMSPTGDNKGMIITFSASSDGQVDKVRIYRTLADETTPYYLVATIDEADGVATDTLSDASLSSEAQSSTFQRLQDKDENELAPVILAGFKNRIWAVPANSNIVYYSVKLEDKGALGLTGNAIMDAFHADNTFTFPTGESIRAVKQYHGRLYFYFAGRVHVIDGCDSPLNPPPDLFHQVIATTDGVIDGDSIVEIGGHVLVTSNKEVKVFDGSPIMQEVGDVNQSLLDALESTFRAVNYKTRWVCGVSTQGNSQIDEIWLLDLSHAEQGLRNWRIYEYDEPLADLLVTATGLLLGAATSTNTLYQLDSGSTDGHSAEDDTDGTDITKTVGLHFLRPKAVYRKVFNGFELGMYFPSGTPTSITATATDQEGNTTDVTLTPSSDTDYRALRSGLRVASESMRLSVVSAGDQLDELRAVTVKWR